MVFGTHVLPHVLQVQAVKARSTIERDVPYRSVAYRVDDRDLGHTFTVSGEIRETAIDEAYLQIERIRRLNDGVARTLDLEDGSTPAMEAVLTDPVYGIDAAEWFSGKYHVLYSVTLLETA